MRSCAVILAGGKGTRSADPSIPKIAQEVGGKPLLDWHFDLIQESSIRHVIVVTGHLGAEVESLVSERSPDGISVECIREKNPRGTVAGLRFAIEQNDFDLYVVLLGDVLVSMPLNSFINSFDQSLKSVGVVVHPSLHPDDSDAVFEDWNEKVLVVPKGGDRSGIPNMSSAGLFAVRSSAVTDYTNVADIGSDLLVQASKNNDLHTFVSSHYLKDAGTPSRLEQVNADVQSSSLIRRGNSMPRRAILLDRDGVINANNPEIYLARDYRVTSGVASAIRIANTAGIPVFVVTNQPGIAKGFMTFEEHRRIRAEMDCQLAEAGAFIDEYFFCPHHPEAGFDGEVSELKIECLCRKPNNRMAREIEFRHGIDLTRSIVIGDTHRDQDLATSIGAEFIHVLTDCKDVESHECVPDAVEAITIATKRLTC